MDPKRQFIVQPNTLSIVVPPCVDIVTFIGECERVKNIDFEFELIFKNLKHICLL